MEGKLKMSEKQGEAFSASVIMICMSSVKTKQTTHRVCDWFWLALIWYDSWRWPAHCNWSLDALSIILVTAPTQHSSYQRKVWSDTSNICSQTRLKVTKNVCANMKQSHLVLCSYQNHHLNLQFWLKIYTPFRIIHSEKKRQPKNKTKKGRRKKEEEKSANS